MNELIAHLVFDGVQHKPALLPAFQQMATFKEIAFVSLVLTA